MSFNRIAALAHLRTELATGTCNPSRGAAELAGRLAVDPTVTTQLHHLGDRQPLTAALLWICIADQLSGQPRIEALTLAAEFALAGGNAGIAANLITRVDVDTRRDHTAIPPIIGTLKLDRRIRDHLPHTPHPEHPPRSPGE